MFDRNQPLYENFITCAIATRKVPRSLAQDLLNMKLIADNPQRRTDVCRAYSLTDDGRRAVEATRHLDLVD